MISFNLFKDRSGSVKSAVLMIYTGGTIGMKEDVDSGALVPFDFSSLLERRSFRQNALSNINFSI